MAVLGVTDIQFIGIGNEFLTRILDEAYANGAPALGEAMRRAIGSYAEPVPDAARLSTQGLMLFGDPALPMSPPPSPLTGERRSSADRRGRSRIDHGVVADHARPARAPRSAAPRASMALAATPDAAGLLHVRPCSPGSAPILLDLTLPPALAGTPYRLSLFDASGRRLRVLERGTAEAGHRVVAWDARDAGGAAVPSRALLRSARCGRRSVASRVRVIR